MTCREMTDFLMDYLDGTLAIDQRRQFERHLAVCPSCVAFLKSYQQLTRLEIEAMCEPGDADQAAIPQGLINAILAARERNG